MCVPRAPEAKAHQGEYYVTAHWDGSVLSGNVGPKTNMNGGPGGIGLENLEDSLSLAPVSAA